MENIAPPLKLIWFVKKSLDRGSSVRAGLNDYLKHESDPWKDQIQIWSIKLQQGGETAELIDRQSTWYRQQTMKLIERGTRGEAIYPHLCLIEKEILEQMQQQIDEFVGRLPYMLLIPLALFLFPACLILMLGPFILQLMEAF